MDWKKVIVEETENSGITMFPSTDKKKKFYPYVILPFESRISVQFQQAMIIALKKLLKQELKEASCIMLPEAKAFLLAPFATAVKKEIVLIRKRNYYVPGQFVIKQEKAYKEEKKGNIFYCVGLNQEDRPLLLDDIISSGKTSIGIIKAVMKKGLKFAGVASFYEREDGLKNIEKETGLKPKAVARLEIVNEKPICILHDF
ncbi:MAG: phosphoribosyltransferase [Candidatus Pacearchaeota archaeon]